MRIKTKTAMYDEAPHFESDVYREFYFLNLKKRN